MKVNRPHIQACAPLPQSAGSKSKIVLCEYIYKKRILYSFLSTDGKASISDCIHDFVGLIKKERQLSQKETLFRSEQSKLLPENFQASIPGSSLRFARSLTAQVGCRSQETWRAHVFLQVDMAPNSSRPCQQDQQDH